MKLEIAMAQEIEQRVAYERQFLEQTYLRSEKSTNDNTKIDTLEEEVVSMPLEDLVNEIKSLNISEEELSETFVKYAKRDQEFVEDLAKVILNGERSKFKPKIHNQTQEIELDEKKYTIKNSMLRYTINENERHVTGIERADLRLKSIVPSLKSKFRHPKKILESKISDASGIKGIVDDYDNLMRTIEIITKKLGTNYTEEGTSQHHKIIEVRIHNDAVLKEDISFLKKLGLKVTNEYNDRTYQAVHINVQNGGRHNIAELQIVTKDMDNVNTYGKASHLNYQRIKARDLEKYKARDIEIICTYEIEEQKSRRGDGKITIEFESNLGREANNYALALLVLMEQKVSKTDYKKTRFKYGPVEKSKTRYQAEFWIAREDKAQIMKEIDRFIDNINDKRKELNEQIIEKYNLSNKQEEKVMTAN